MIRAIIFDFDGTIVDTESSEYEAWRETYREMGCELCVEEWTACVGHGIGEKVFNPYTDLETKLGYPIDHAAIRINRRLRHLDLIRTQPLLPGVESYLHNAARQGLPLGIASSSHREWVDGHLNRLGIRSRFVFTACADDVSRIKPDPELYLTALRGLGVEAHEAVAIEDSGPGVTAAKAAGIYCIAVPNPMTTGHDLSQADQILASLEDLPFADLPRYFEMSRRTQAEEAIHA